ncbi:MAG: hypothetical protein FD174_1546 [Geobacteraceae bacterium]|nr:MAG: hypothetical protein FD174_1546 [Geobacteraceae bacterium]
MIIVNVALQSKSSQQARDDGKTAVMVMDPVATLSIIGNQEITEVAKLVAEKMRQVLAAL